MLTPRCRAAFARRETLNILRRVTFRSGRMIEEAPFEVDGTAEPGLVCLQCRWPVPTLDRGGFGYTRGLAPPKSYIDLEMLAERARWVHATPAESSVSLPTNLLRP